MTEETSTLIYGFVADDLLVNIYRIVSPKEHVLDAFSVVIINDDDVHVLSKRFSNYQQLFDWMMFPLVSGMIRDGKLSA